MQKARVLVGGRTGQELGVHEPVVTKATYTHNAPGQGKTKGAKDVKKRKSRKHAKSGVRPYSKLSELTPKDIRKLKLSKTKKAAKILAMLATKGKVKF